MLPGVALKSLGEMVSPCLISLLILISSFHFLFSVISLRLLVGDEIIGFLFLFLCLFCYVRRTLLDSWIVGVVFLFRASISPGVFDAEIVC